jgi:hypothetical protein
MRNKFRESTLNLDDLGYSVIGALNLKANGRTCYICAERSKTAIRHAWELGINGGESPWQSLAKGKHDRFRHCISFAHGIS